MNFLCQGFPKLSSDGHTGRQTSYACPLPATGQDDSHTIRSAIPENPMLHANLMALSSTEPELWATEVYMAGIGILNVFRSCDLDLDPMTFVYELHPYSLEIHRTCKYERRTSRLSKLSSVLRRDRQVGHFQSRDKDGGHINGSAIPENSMLYTNQMALSFLKPELRAKFTWWKYIYLYSMVASKKIGLFDLYCSCVLHPDPMTFTYELDS